MAELRKYLFCNVGWMEHYEGDKNTGDDLLGMAGYIKKKKTGHEVCNFAPDNNKKFVFGYVQTKNDSQMKLEKIVDFSVDSGSESKEEKKERKKADEEEKVFVIWTAPLYKDKKYQKKRVVVGWYKDATVLRHKKDFEHGESPECHCENSKEKINHYRIRAKHEDAERLRPYRRTTEVMTKKGGMGRQCQFWYGKSDYGRKLANKVWQEAENMQGGNGNRYQGSTDSEHNKKVEDAAVNEATAYYVRKGYIVKDVGKYNFGWDLDAKSDKGNLRIEVKGLSGSIPTINLTSNEYRFFKEQASDYHLAIVTNALTKPILQVCYFSNESESWKVFDSNKASVISDEIVSAQVKIKNK